jgi:hypothetical protein
MEFDEVKIYPITSLTFLKKLFNKYDIFNNNNEHYLFISQ